MVVYMFGRSDTELITIRPTVIKHANFCGCAHLLLEMGAKLYVRSPEVIIQVCSLLGNATLITEGTAAA